MLWELSLQLLASPFPRCQGFNARPSQSTFWICFYGWREHFFGVIVIVKLRINWLLLLFVVKYEMRKNLIKVVTSHLMILSVLAHVHHVLESEPFSAVKDSRYFIFSVNVLQPKKWVLSCSLQLRLRSGDNFMRLGCNALSYHKLLVSFTGNCYSGSLDHIYKFLR